MRSEDGGRFDLDRHASAPDRCRALPHPLARLLGEDLGGVARTRVGHAAARGRHARGADAAALAVTAPPTAVLSAGPLSRACRFTGQRPRQPYEAGVSVSYPVSVTATVSPNRAPPTPGM